MKYIRVIPCRINDAPVMIISDFVENLAQLLIFNEKLSKPKFYIFWSTGI